MTRATKLPLSVIIITKNAAAYLAQVLNSVQELAQEIVLVDSGSTDATLRIAEDFGAKIYQTSSWPGFGPQKNYALSLATQAWVLALDADEVLSDDLKCSIRRALLKGTSAAYQLERISYFCGAFIQHSGWRPDWVLRLFPRTAAVFSADLVHEKVCLKEALPVQRLAGVLWHYSSPDFETVLNKINDYSSAGAKMCQQQGKSVSLLKAVARAFWTFIRVYLFKAGFLDGKYGLMLAIANAEGVYYKYVKYWLLQQKNSRL